MSDLASSKAERTATYDNGVGARQGKMRGYRLREGQALDAVGGLQRGKVWGRHLSNPLTSTNDEHHPPFCAIF